MVLKRFEKKLNKLSDCKESYQADIFIQLYTARFSRPQPENNDYHGVVAQQFRRW